MSTEFDDLAATQPGVHSREPWYVQQSDHAGVGLLIKPIPGYVVAEMEIGENTEANARRIVACVNACADIPTDALEDGEVTINDQCGDVAYQRDVLHRLFLATERWEEICGKETCSMEDERKAEAEFLATLEEARKVSQELAR